MTTISPIGLGAALRRAYSTRDAAGLAALYAPDATIEIVDAVHTPSRPSVLSGGEALLAHFEDVFARDMTHDVETVAAGDDCVGYSLRCTYADGTKVVCAATATLLDGRIVRELGVQAWDA